MRSLRRDAGLCSVRAIVPIVIALLAVGTATHVLTPAAVGVPEPVINIEDFVAAARRNAHAKDYAWLTHAQSATFEALSDRIPTTDGYQRVMLPSKSFGDWLRHLPVATATEDVVFANGKTFFAAGDESFATAIHLQPHTNALGAAGMMIRLRAEHGWSTKSLDRTTFHFATGQRMSWRAWASGVRALVGDDGPHFEMTGIADDSRDSFCAWIETQLQFTSCVSLLDDTRCVDDGTISPGDVLLRGGRDAHVVIVLDVATDAAGRVAIMLGSGNTPASTFHVMRAPSGSPWFELSSRSIETGSQGRFELDQLRRWAL
jgi:hypothetical protein